MNVEKLADEIASEILRSPKQFKNCLDEGDELAEGIYDLLRAATAAYRKCSKELPKLERQLMQAMAELIAIVSLEEAYAKIRKTTTTGI